MESSSTHQANPYLGTTLFRGNLVPKGVRVERSILSSWKRLDLLLLALSFAFVLLGPAIFAHHMGISRVLSVRISVTNFLLGLCCLVLWQYCIVATRVRARHLPVSIRLVAAQLVLRVSACTVVVWIVLFLRHPERASLAFLSAFWLLSFFLLVLGRCAWLAIVVYVAPLLRQERRVIIVGSGPRAQQVADQIHMHPRWHYRLLGFVDSDPQAPADRMLGTTNELARLLMQQAVDEVIIALPVKSKYDEIQQAIAACEQVGVQSAYSTDLFTTVVTKRRSAEDEQASSVILHMVHHDRRRYLKRSLDILVAGLGLLVLSPLLAVIALIIRLTSSGPALFRQQRYGLNRHIFTMYKFRSMRQDAERQQQALEHLNEAGGPVFKIRHDPRITTVGRFIRRTSIDEIPQLINVLLGDMSLVGPRPLPLRDVNRFPEVWLMRRFSVKPGMTGLWQVSGRSDTAFSSWIALDLKYIDAWSLLLDFTILVKTVPAVLKREGAA